MHATQAGARRRPDRETRRTERVLAAERRIGWVTRLLDDLVAVPGTGSRVGLDPIVGLIPFVGDFVTMLVGAWIVGEAARFRLPGIVLARMVINVTVDFVVGLVPLVGDLVDFGFKSNTRNLELFHRHAVDPGASTSGSRAFVFGVLLMILGVAWGAVVLVQRLVGLVL